ncbi:vitamin K-dependent protein S-like isoform X2 [Microcaecilia unicolor]|uniref:Vitamin K-dependent protein S-like isoform X2 n=1 Tax=Microcaecilia unicolor TaxID=1415580 RepID=A0A6P7Z8K4_9AMPH|nr:vitamin K-dependent protein S-like isoform X2 [Microcaecilia unicolor]
MALRVFLLLTLLLECNHPSEGSTIKQEPPSSEKSMCAPLETSKSTNILHLGNGANLGVLLMEFHWPSLTSSLSSFDFRTYDSEGIIFHGEIDGPGSWFLLALRQRRLEIQMSNEHGQMMISQLGPNISDGKWRRVSIDRNETIIEIRLDGILLLDLYHTSADSSNNTWLTIALGGLIPNSTVQLLSPLQFALDGCIRNWSWVETEVHTLNNAMEINEHRRCFEHEKEGSYFPGSGYAQFEVPVFLINEDDPKDATPWGLRVEVSFRPVLATGVLFAVQGQNTMAFSFAMDSHKKAFTITLFDKQFSKHFPDDFCVGNWQSAKLKLLNSHLTLNTPIINATWNIHLNDFKALKSVWNKSTTTFYIGGIPGILLALNVCRIDLH